jgi:hypothetical protein
MNSGKPIFLSFITRFRGGTLGGRSAVKSCFFIMFSSIGCWAYYVIFLKRTLYVEIISSSGAFLARTVTFLKSGGTGLMVLKYLLPGWSHTYEHIWPNFIVPNIILLKPTLVNSRTKNSSVKGVSGCLIYISSMNYRNSC